MSTTLRIGTRDSQLAMWQARFVANQLHQVGFITEIVPIKSEGDIVLDTPLPLMGGKGVFTKALDDALLDDRIDLAVHSYKDIPTALPEGLIVTAVLERHDVRDALVCKTSLAQLESADYQAIIATSSTRRKAQWLWKYPQHRTTDIRGNVNTRLRKLADNPWDATIFAAAGLQRIGLDHHISAHLDWMIPAPAQGAIAVVSKHSHFELTKKIGRIDHLHTRICTQVERDFLRILEAGCSAPVAALASISEQMLTFQGCVLSTDGQQRIDVSGTFGLHETASAGERMAEAALQQGAATLLTAAHDERRPT